MDDANHYKRDIGAVLHANDQRQRRLERLMVSSNPGSIGPCAVARLADHAVGDVPRASFRVHGLVGDEDRT